MNLKKVLLTGLTFLLGVAILPVSIAINNAVNDKGIKPMKTISIDLNDIEFEKLSYYQSNKVYYVAEVDEYFVVVQDYENFSEKTQSCVNKDGKFTYVTSEEDASAIRKVFIIDSIRENKNISVMFNDESMMINKIYQPIVNDNFTSLVNTLLTSKFGTASEQFNFETDYNFFSCKVESADGTSGTSITKNYDFDAVEISLVNDELAGELVDTIEIFYR